MGPDKWVDLDKRVSKEYAIWMFNFKEWTKKKMLKVQYFKHPQLAHHIYDRFLIGYGRLPCNDEVTHYFVKFFYAKVFLNMKPNYTNVKSKYYSIGKGITYEWKGALRDENAAKANPPLVPHPTKPYYFTGRDGCNLLDWFRGNNHYKRELAINSSGGGCGNE